MTDEDTSHPETLRLDKWLWHARVFKTRTLASKVCASGRVRVNGTPVAKAHHALKPGDVLTLPVGSRIRVLRVRAVGTRRGPAPEARQLYEDLSPSLYEVDSPPLSADPAPDEASTGAGSGAEGGAPLPPGQPSAHPLGECSSGPQAPRPRGSGRPTKAERRAVNRLRERD